MLYTGCSCIFDTRIEKVEKSFTLSFLSCKKPFVLWAAISLSWFRASSFLIAKKGLRMINDFRKGRERKDYCCNARVEGWTWKPRIFSALQNENGAKKRCGFCNFVSFSEYWSECRRVRERKKGETSAFETRQMSFWEKKERDGVLWLSLFPN